MRIRSLTHAIDDGSLSSALDDSAEPLPRLMIPISYRLLPAIVAAFDGVLVFVIGVGSGFAYDAIAHTHGNLNTYIASGIAIAALFYAFARPAELYRPSNLLRISLQIRRAAAAWIMAFGCVATITFVLKIGAMFSRGATLSFFFGGLLLLAVSRVLWTHAVGSVIASGVLARKRVAVVGKLDQLKSNELLPEVQRYGYVITHAFALPDNPSAEPDESIGVRMREIVAYAQSARLDEIILAIPWLDARLLNEMTTHLKVLPIPVKLIPDIAISRLLARPLYELGETKAVELQHAPLSLAQCIIKQAIDRTLAAACLFLLSPLFGIVALAIRLESPGPAFFLQARVGFNGRRFRIFKFRTMSTLDDGSAIQQAQRNDKRVTGLGRLLRKLSIDELPQLLNVLRGDMSLVGPRPHALAHDDAYDRLISSYAMRRKVKPGITGWAQVNGCRGETPDIDAMERRIDHDLWYIEYWSIWLDLRILLMTAVQVLRPKDVY